MKRFLIWTLVLVESGFANLNLPMKTCARDRHESLGHSHRVCGGDQRVPQIAFVRALNCLKLGGELRTHTCTYDNRPICSLRMSYNDDIHNCSIPTSKSPAIHESRGLSLDWVADPQKRPLPQPLFHQPLAQSHHTLQFSSHRPGFEVPSTWREGVNYEFGASHKFTRGETVAVLFSDGSLRFGRIERIPRAGDAEHMVQV
jgi:hypothetical protein